MDNKTLIDQLSLFREGNQEAFTRVYNELKTPVYTIAFRILYDRNLSEDIVQEVFMKLFQTPPPSTIKNPRAWVFKVTRNLAIDFLRKRKDSIEFIEGSHLDTQVNKEFSALQLDVEETIRKLEEQERQIVTLRLNGELKFKDIAEIVEQPLGTVLWRYQKTMTQIRNYLNERND